MRLIDGVGETETERHRQIIDSRCGEIPNKQNSFQSFQIKNSCWIQNFFFSTIYSPSLF